MPECGGLRDQILGLQDGQDGAHGRRGQRTAGERRRMQHRIVVQRSEHLVGGQHGTDRDHPAGQDLAGQQDVRHDVLDVGRPPGADPAEPGLDLVEDQQRAGSGAQFPNRSEIPGGRDVHAALAQDRFQQHATAFGVDAQPTGQVVDVTEFPELDPRQQRLERRSVGGPTGHAQRTECLAVKSVPHRDDPGAAVQPGQLERDLDGLGTGVGQVDVIQSGGGHAGERLRRIGCHPADQRLADQGRCVELPLDRVDDDRVAVADQVDPEAGAVQVSDAVRVIEMVAFRPFG